MTRETRIGLIVGLAFIVLFGVVLSELGTSGEVPEGKSDRVSRGFYARAPVTGRLQQNPRREAMPLVARRKTGAERSANDRGAPGRRRSQQPPSTARTDRTPGHGVAPRRTVGTVAPTGRAVRGGGREMTVDEFATAHGVGDGAGRGAHRRMYVTRRGDNLTAIARKFYRTPSRKAVMKIFNANRNVLQTPDALGVGVKIVIPN